MTSASLFNIALYYFSCYQKQKGRHSCHLGNGHWICKPDYRTYYQMGQFILFLDGGPNNIGSC